MQLQYPLHHLRPRLTLLLGFESSDLPLTPPATDLPSRRLASLPSLASPVKRILQLDEEQDVTSRLEEVRAVSPLHSATVLKPVRRVAKTLPGHG